VALLNASGTVIASTVSDRGGWFYFGQLAAGTYQLEYTPPAGQVILPGSAVNPTTDLTAPFTLTAGQALWAPNGAMEAAMTLTGAVADTVHAAGGDVTISATGANNLFDPGPGMSFLNADGSSGNVFMLNPAATGSLTTISGFDVAAHDILDLSRTLAGTSAASDLSNVASYITAVTNGNATDLYVDPTGGYGTPMAFAVLNGVQTSVAALQAAGDFSLR